MSPAEPLHQIFSHSLFVKTRARPVRCEQRKINLTQLCFFVNEKASFVMATLSAARGTPSRLGREAVTQVWIASPRRMPRIRRARDDGLQAQVPGPCSASRPSPLRGSRLTASLDPYARPKPMVDKKPCCGGAVTAKRPKHSEGAPERRSTATTRRGFAVSYVFIPDTALSAAADRGRVWPSARGRTIAVGPARSRRWSPRQWRDDGKPPQGGN